MPKFSPTSWHAKLHKFFHSTEHGYYNQPTNLCPYFWSLLTGIILFPFIFLFYLPGYIILRIDDIYRRESKPGFYTSTGLAMGIFSYICISILVLLSAVIWADHNSKWYVNSIMSWVAVGTAGVIALIIYLIDKAKNRTKKDGVVTSFIKAKMTGICPKIDWEE